MADIWLDVDTALAEVPVNILPLLDDTDFKSRETAVAFNAAGMDLVWNFVTTDGAYVQTAVTPTSAGNYDWAHQGDGMYSIEIPASGGASINNDTEGFGWFTGVATGVLPWRGPIIGFRAAALNNSLIDAGTTGLLAPTVAARTLDVSAGGEAGIDWANVGSPTTALALTNTSTATVTTATNVTTVNGLAANVITAASAAADFGAEIADAVWDEAVAGHVSAGTFGKTDADILADTNELQTDWVNGGRLDLLIDSIISKVDTIDDFLDTEIAAILAAVDTEVAAIKAKTDGLTFTVANVLDANIQRINDVTLNGNGAGTPWGP
jgi:hypothetical protein